MSFRRRSEGLGRAKVACDACRHKKAKCDGLVPCTRCRDGRNDDICCYSRRIESSEQVFSAMYVKMLRRQLHITLSSLRFLVERIALEKDCKKFVPELDTPINTVINLIQESSEFDHEQGQEYLEVSDSELTMLSPQELPSNALVEREQNNEERSEAQPFERKMKSELSPGKQTSTGVHKRKGSDGDCDEQPHKPTRGRPKKERRTSSFNGPNSGAIAATPSYQQQQHQLDHRDEQGASYSASADSTPLTPVSVPSDAGDDSPVRSTSFSNSFISTADNHNVDKLTMAKPVLFAPPEYRPLTAHQPPPAVGSAMGPISMGPVIEEEEILGPQLQVDLLDRADTGLAPASVARPWDFQTRIPYDASRPAGNGQDLDFFAVDDSLPTWQMQSPSISSTMVSLHDIEYHMPG